MYHDAPMCMSRNKGCKLPVQLSFIMSLVDLIKDVITNREGIKLFLGMTTKKRLQYFISPRGYHTKRNASKILMFDKNRFLFILRNVR